MQYEVETRFYFNNKEEAFAELPFLASCLNTKIEWETFHYGLDLFKQVSARSMKIALPAVSITVLFFLFWVEKAISTVPMK